MVQLNEVQTIVSEIADFTQQRKKEPTQARKHETTLQAQAEKRRAINRSRTGFYPTPEDFSPFLTARRSDCCSPASQLQEPLQTTHNKLLALLLESLCAVRLITLKWQRIAEAKGYFLSKLGKPCTAKNLSAAKQIADIINVKHEEQIFDCIRALEAAQS